MCVGLYSQYYSSFRFYEKIKKRKIKYKKIHEFASDRWIKSESVETARFWKSVMDWCVKTEILVKKKERS